MHSPGAGPEFSRSVALTLYENLLINFINLILNEFLMWLKNGHFNNRAAKSGLGGDLQQIIHKVIHKFCG
jgi:hypothetical protein